MKITFKQFGAILMMLAVGGCASPAQNTAEAPAIAETAPPETVPPSPQTETTAPDPRNASYSIEGELITLVDGVATAPLAPGSSSERRTSYFGNEAKLDLNADGLEDVAFLLVDEPGGTGSFFYVVAALNTPNGYQGTNAVFLGDRVAPQSTAIDPNNPAQFVVSYGDRASDEAMSAAPTLVVSKGFRVEGGQLVEVQSTPTPTP